MADFLCFDFETLSNNPLKGNVVSLGAIAGDWSDVNISSEMAIANSIQTLRNKGIEIFIDYENQPGREINDATLAFWAKQPQNVRDHVFKSTPRINLELLNDTFLRFCRKQEVNSDTIVLVRAPHFDHTLMDSIWQQFGQENNCYSHWKVRDTRSIVDTLSGGNRGHLIGFEQYMTKTFDMKKHSSLDDTIIDVLEVAFCYNGAKEQDFAKYK